MLLFAGSPVGQEDRLLQRALQKVAEKEDYLGALTDLQKLLERPSPNPIVHYHIGVCHTILGNYSKSVESFRLAQEKGVDNWEVWSGLGLAYFHLGQDSLARKHFRRILDSKPRELTALFYLGRLEVKKGRHIEGEKKFRQVLEREPGHQGALFGLGNALLQQGKTVEAKKVLEYHRNMGHLRNRLKTLTRMASSPRAGAEVFADLGNVYADFGDRKSALEAFDRAESLGANPALSSLGRGKISYFEGNFAAAEGHLNRYLKEVEENCDAYQFLGLASKELQKYPEAAQALQAAFKLCAPDPILYHHLGELEIHQGNLTRAVELAKEVMRLDPVASSGPFLMALCRLYQQDLTGAEASALQALRLAEANPDNHRLLATIYRAKGDLDRAGKHQEQVERLSRQSR